MAKNIPISEIRDIVLGLDSKESIMIPNKIMSESRANAERYPQAYRFLAKKFLEYVEAKYGKSVDTDIFTYLFTRSLVPFCSESFVEYLGKNNTKAWGEVKEILDSFAKPQEYSIGMDEFVAGR
ncbi:MAG: hypothetical protein NTY68_00265 [Candidatus Micrarchaeota archaeon]|nr:hypothetical protein [Candidatus Micrarchaeota archaeon]